MKTFKFLPFLFLLTFSVTYSQSLGNISGMWKLVQQKHLGKLMDLTRCDTGMKTIFGDKMHDNGYKAVVFSTAEGCPKRQSFYYEIKNTDGNYIINFLTKNSNGSFEIFESYNILTLNESQLWLLNYNESMDFERVYE